MRFVLVLIFLLAQILRVGAQAVPITANYAVLTAGATVQNVFIALPAFVSAQAGTFVKNGIGCAGSGIGWSWSAASQQFMPPQPFGSWHAGGCLWVPPNAVQALTPAMISANQRWQWFEVSQQWGVVQF